jgi:hypothetical protein
VWGSTAFYAALILTVVGLGLAVKPVPRFGVATRRRAFAVVATGLGVAVLALLLPVWDSRVSHPSTRLDAFVPVWQFHEVHTIEIAAPPARVFDAIRQVRADEISLFRTLTWIRRGGRPVPPSILNPGAHEPVLDVATRTGFVHLAADAPHELVIGTVVLAPPGARRPPLSPRLFETPPPGFALAAMNFVVTGDGTGGSRVSTETRVFASGPSARRRFAAYWRAIYPGSALIRRAWLRAIQRRAERTPEAAL